MDGIDKTSGGSDRFRAGAAGLRSARARGRRAGAVVAALGFCLLAGGCTTASRVSTKYYEVSGATAPDLDREIGRKGPMNGKAIAMAGIHIRPVAIVPTVANGQCRFGRASFQVNADITLPRWREAASSRDAQLQRNWKGFAAYARAHEDAHVAIAEAFARALERAFLAIPPQPSCARLEVVALDLVRRARSVHDKAQLAFDESEKRRLGRLVAQAKRQQRQ